ncbi:MAG: S41 family peptidase [Ferruginibacter sp.]
MKSGVSGKRSWFFPRSGLRAIHRFRNFEQDVFVHNIKENKTTNLSKTGITETNPIWSPDGKYIYLVSQRLKAAYPFGLPDAKLYRLPLEKLDDPFRMDKYEELFKEEIKDSAKKNDSAKKDTTKKDTSKIIVAPVVIDTQRLMERLEQVGPTFGTQYLSFVYQKGDKTTILYASNHGEGRNALWKTVIEPFEQNKTEKITGTEINYGFDILEVSDKLFVLSGGNISKLSLDGNKTDPINISFTFRRNLSAEFDQMFHESWAQIQENYYDENFHGLNWEKTKLQYNRFLPYLNNRADLRVMLNDMLGELNSSHQGFGTNGEDETITLTNRTMETGILFKEEEPYTVQKIVRRSAAERKGIDIREGDILVKVNEELVQEGRDRNYYFTRPSLDKELKMTFSRNGKNYEVKVHPQAVLFSNLYDEWIDINRQRVNEIGKGRIAYGYMKNMGKGELEGFIIDMTEQLGSKDALIFDLRYNTGGNVHDEVLNFLSQRSYLQWKYREGKLTPQPNFSPGDKPIILLINEQSLSDAEMTANGFKTLKLGKIIGNETYRWIIFTSGISLVDNSSVRMPSWGCYTLDGKDLEQTGVQPDIKVVNTFEDKLNGKDPQLDRAIEEILKELHIKGTN